MKVIFVFLFALAFGYAAHAQETSNAGKFWLALQKHCGRAYEGTLAEAPANDTFTGKKLLMHVRSCNDKIIKIPFFVGDDKSRTWVLTFDNNLITLKHDHRHEDGSEDKVTQYGGTSPNTGMEGIQFFPADAFTSKLIPAASTNVWWITLDDSHFSYNLRRIGSDRVFTVKFDLTKSVVVPPAPWGWKD